MNRAVLSVSCVGLGVLAVLTLPNQLRTTGLAPTGTEAESQVGPNIAVVPLPEHRSRAQAEHATSQPAATAFKVLSSTGHAVAGAELRAEVEGSELGPWSSDELGSVAASGRLAETACTITVSSDGFEPLVARATTYSAQEPNTLVLTPQGVIRGQVVAGDGLPIAEELIVCAAPLASPLDLDTTWELLGRGSCVEPSTGLVVGTCDRSGRFELPVTPDTDLYRIHVGGEGLVMPAPGVAHARPGSTVSLEVNPAYVLKVSVIDQDGEPVVGGEQLAVGSGGLKYSIFERNLFTVAVGPSLVLAGLDPAHADIHGPSTMLVALHQKERAQQVGPVRVEADWPGHTKGVLMLNVPHLSQGLSEEALRVERMAEGFGQIRLHMRPGLAQQFRNTDMKLAGWTALLHSEQGDSRRYRVVVDGEHLVVPEVPWGQHTLQLSDWLGEGQVLDPATGDKALTVHVADAPQELDLSHLDYSVITLEAVDGEGTYTDSIAARVQWMQEGNELSRTLNLGGPVHRFAISRETTVQADLVRPWGGEFVERGSKDSTVAVIPGGNAVLRCTAPKQ